MPTKVFYNGTQVTGEPFVSRSFQPVDYGNRWGMAETVTLNGVVTGVYKPLIGYPDHDNDAGNAGGQETKPTGLTHFITDVFKTNFQSLQVKEGNTVYYDWPSAVVESVDFEESKWGIGSPVKYTVKLKSNDIFSSHPVLEPSDSYSFTENEDGTVDVTHKVSAKGIKTGSVSPFERARQFVDQYVGVDHYESTWLSSPYFVTNKKPTLLSRSENVNRLEGSYSVTEIYKYYKDSNNTSACSECENNQWQGDAQNFSNEDQCRAYYGCALTTPYLKTVKINQNKNASDEFNTVNYDVEYKGGLDDSNSIQNLRTVVNTETSSTHRTYEKEIAQELLGSSSLHNKVYQVSISLQEDDAANKLSVKTVYQTGDTPLTNPYFDYKVDLSKDEITDICTYSINGELKSFGNLETKKSLLKNFKDANYETIETYLHGKITSSKAFEVFGNETCANCDNGRWADNYASLTACRTAQGCTDRVVNPYPKTLKWNENPNKATISLNAEFSDADYVANSVNAKYAVSVTSSKGLYKELPSANVEGLFVLQDLNCQTATNTKVTVNGDAPHKGPHVNTFDSNYKTADILALETLRSLKDAVIDEIVPNDPKYYNNNSLYSYAREKVEESDDTQFPYTFSINEGYLHTPTTNNSDVLDKFKFGNELGFTSNITNYQRPDGYKFGY